MDFRTRLLNTLRAVQPILRVPGVLVAGSEVPNLLEPGAKSSLVVSQDLDLAVPVDQHAEVKARLVGLGGLERSPEEPSVWVPRSQDLLELNFIGMEPRWGASAQTYMMEDAELPLLVFRHLSLLRPGPPLRVEDLVVPVPRPAGLLLEKLVTDRSGEKGDRDLLVALGLLLVSRPSDLLELEEQYGSLAPEERYAARSGLTTLSLLESRASMPDPTTHRDLVARVVARLERVESGL